MALVGKAGSRERSRAMNASRKYAAHHGGAGSYSKLRRYIEGSPRLKIKSESYGSKVILPLRDGLRKLAIESQSTEPYPRRAERLSTNLVCTNSERLMLRQRRRARSPPGAMATSRANLSDPVNQPLTIEAQRSEPMTSSLSSGMRPSTTSGSTWKRAG